MARSLFHVASGTFHSPRRWGLKVENLDELRREDMFHSPRRWGLKENGQDALLARLLVSLPT